jgi:recombination protein RecA
MNHQPSTLSSPTFGNRKLPMGNFLHISDRFTAIDPRLAGVTPASRLSVRPAPEMVFSGIAAIDELTGGLPRGCLTEICGPASSGRTALLLAALSAATRRGEFCALVDASDALDPQSAAAAGVQFERLLWIRCGESSPQKHFSTRQKADSKRNEGRNAENRLEQVLRVTDLLLESGGFGVVALDLADLPPPAARRIPLATWFRFRRAVEPTSTVLLTLEQQPIAGSCSSLVMKLHADSGCYLSKSPLVFSPGPIPITERSHVPSHAQLLEQIEIKAELIRSRLEGKPVGSVAFASRTAWADVKAG